MTNNGKKDVSDRSLVQTLHNYFSQFAQHISHWAGQPAAFLLAVSVIVIWGITGPIFGFSDTWQLIINTGTTIVTFLMVFLIQNTQNRDTLALHLKLSELVFAMKGAKNEYAALENMDDDELENLHEAFRKRADQAHATLEARRSDGREVAQSAKAPGKKTRRQRNNKSKKS